MKIQTRLIVLLLFLLAVFGATLAALRQAHVRETEQMLAGIAKERGELLDRLLELTGVTLKNFASDYSLWTEMVEFVGHGDPQWAEVNLTASLPNFNVHGAWVLRPDGAQVYGVVRELSAAFQPLTPRATQLIAQAGSEPAFFHFFESTTAGLLEFRIAPVQPSADAARVSRPQGWLVVARLWDGEHLESLQKILEGEVAIRPQVQPAPAGARVVHRELPDAAGGVAGVLHVIYRPQAVHLLDRENAFETTLFYAFGSAMLLFMVVGVSRWVLGPLRQLEHSLTTGNAAPLKRLRHERDEFGRLATLVESSFEQRRILEREVEERRRVEDALRQSEEDVRSASDLKSRLARDLHDGVIQSIYAAGLGLEGVRALLRHDPEAADRRLAAAQTSLNQTIREVRSFIHGLEPEETERRNFPQALRSLVATLQSLHAAELRLQIDPAPPQLSAREEVHALQIVRECVSNALRHGGARRIEITFSTVGGEPMLEIRDDGRGFDVTTARASGGSGLSNLESRAAEIGAQLAIHSSPGKGTGISLRFRQIASTP